MSIQHKTKQLNTRTQAAPGYKQKSPGLNKRLNKVSKRKTHQESGLLKQQYLICIQHCSKGTEGQGCQLLKNMISLIISQNICTLDKLKTERRQFLD